MPSPYGNVDAASQKRVGLRSRATLMVALAVGGVGLVVVLLGGSDDTGESFVRTVLSAVGSTTDDVRSVSVIDGTLSSPGRLDSSFAVFSAGMRAEFARSDKIRLVSLDEARALVGRGDLVVAIGPWIQVGENTSMQIAVFRDGVPDLSSMTVKADRGFNLLR